MESHGNRKIKIVILAAGKGKRMESDLPKVLAPLKGEAMIKHVIREAEKAGLGKPVSIIGHKGELVRSELGDLCFYVNQDEQLGTGHAVSCARGECAEAEDIIVLSGDQPLIKAETIRSLVEKHLESGAMITFTSTEVPDFSDWRAGFAGFGRVLREGGKMLGIREFKDASEDERNIKEVNAGCYIFNAAWMWQNLEKIKNENAQKEYYLTDLFKIASEHGDKIETVKIDPLEALGANTKDELAVLERMAA